MNPGHGNYLVHFGFTINTITTSHLYLSQNPSIVNTRHTDEYVSGKISKSAEIRCRYEFGVFPLLTKLADSSLIVGLPSMLLKR